MITIYSGMDAAAGTVLYTAVVFEFNARRAVRNWSRLSIKKLRCSVVSGRVRSSSSAFTV